MTISPTSSSATNSTVASIASDLNSPEQSPPSLPSGDISARQAYSNYEQRPGKDIYHFTEEQLRQYSSLDENAVHSTYENLNNLNLFARVIHRVFLDGRDVNMDNLSISDPMSDFWKVATIIAGIILAPLSLACAICYLIRNSIMNSLNEREVLELMAEDEAIPVNVQKGMGGEDCGALNVGLFSLLKPKTKEEADEVDEVDEPSDSEDESDTEVTTQPKTLYEQLREHALSNANRKERLDITTELVDVGQRLSSVSTETFVEGLESITTQIEDLSRLVKGFDKFDDSEVDINLHREWDGWVNGYRYNQAVEVNLLRINRARRPIMRAYEQVEGSIIVLSQVVGNLDLKDSFNTTFFSQQGLEEQILNVFLSMQGMMSLIQPQDTSLDKETIRYNLKYCKESLRVQVEKFQELLKEWNEIKESEDTSEDKIEQIDQCIELVDQILLTNTQFLEFAEGYNLNLRSERAAQNVDGDLSDREQVLLCTELFPSIYTDLSHARSFSTYYNQDGYNIDGYNREGYNRNGYDRDRYNREGFTALGYDRDGFNSLGFNTLGFDVNGYDRQGHNLQGYNRAGYNRRGFDVNNQTVYNENGQNPAGFNREGYNPFARDFEGYDRAGFSQYGRTRDGYDRAGSDRNGRNRDGHYVRPHYGRYGY